MTLDARTLAAVLLLAAAPVAAQPPASSPAPGDLSVDATDSKVAVPLSESFNIGAWHLQTDFTSKLNPTRPIVGGLPKWQLGVRTNRQVFSRVQLGAAAGATRGHEGPAFLSQELGTGRDMSVATSLTGPGTYRTVWNTTLTVAVPLKTTGRLNLTAVGELWNPFGNGVKNDSGDTLLRSRAFRVGLTTGF